MSTEQTRSEENTKSLPAFRQVIKECIKRDVAGAGFIGPILDDVLNERFPLGKGGVGHANRKAQARIREEIEAFYSRPVATEPTCGREFA
jgi:hypothetical protein